VPLSNWLALIEWPLGKWPWGMGPGNVNPAGAFWDWFGLYN